ncbi:MAG: dienelactone hydrolase family protein [Gammaproteobacteria bacterium]|nr:dienelactone hydrolase family protein [Gammaproteobacteria bacterium]
MADIRTEEMTYTAGDTTCRGHVAYDAAAGGPRPGVLVVHEWWGLDDYIRGRARMLAELGYTALAVDMYGDGQTAPNPDGAAALMNAVLGDMEAGTARLRVAYDVLAGHSAADAARMAAIGYCFGGAMVLHCARIGMDLKGVVSFHGSLGSTHKPEKGKVKAKVLVCHGAADTFVSDEEIAGFKQEMTDAGADWRFIAYDGALHGFSNPHATANGEKYGLPLAYDEAVDKRSWDDMNALFSEIF